MAINTKSSVAALIPEVLAETIQAGFAGMEVMMGNPACILNPTLDSGRRAGDIVTVPYFANLGEFEFVAEGTPLTPAAVTSSKETCTVTHGGRAIEITEWARYASQTDIDPYKALSQNLLGGFQRAVGSKLLTAARTGVPGGMTHDVYNAGTPVKFSYDVMVDAKMLFGDEQDDIAAVVMHSKTLGDLYKTKLTTGEPFFATAVNGSLPTIMGVPIFVSDRLTATGAKYDTLLLKRGALAAWHSSATVLTDSDILMHSSLAAVHIYVAVHRYSTLPSRTKGGVVLIQHN